MRFVLRALRANLLPNFAFVFFSVIRFFKLIGALHCPDVLTTRPLRLPDVQRTPRLILLPLLRHTIRASVIVSLSSSNLMNPLP